MFFSYAKEDTPVLYVAFASAPYLSDAVMARR